MKLHLSDTIAAIATPLAEGAISVIRISGPSSIAIADNIFRGKYRLAETPGYTIRHGSVIDKTGKQVDDVLVSVFRAPASYTGEDCIEISCHGGMYVTREVLRAVLEAGARQADPGEFTKRAFLNGKLDLVQAEAVADLIRAGGERALRNSRAHLNGELGEKVRALRNKITDACALLELQLDFSEEEVPLVHRAQVEATIVDCQETIRSILSTFHLGKIVKSGASVVLVGRPNVGKSSLFNRLLMEDRAIVSGIPGTTRDSLEESISIDGVVVKLIDTAGLRNPENEVEFEGMRRSRIAYESADLRVLIVDATTEPSRHEVESLARQELGATDRMIVAVNKVDLAMDVKYLDDWITVSALTGFGIDRLRRVIGEHLSAEFGNQDSGILISSERQGQSLQVALDWLDKSLLAARSGLSHEFIATDMRSAVTSLSEIIGDVATDEVLDRIFSMFCIGK